MIITLKFLIFMLFAHEYLCDEDEEPANFTDLGLCKVSHLGLEYMGDVLKSESGIRCQSWSSDSPHKIPENIIDDQFSDHSRKKAKNYCRNPTRDPLGPWCYTMNHDLKFETCGLPLCSFPDCRITGPGMEYSGKHKKGVSDRKCLKWNKDRKKVKELDGRFERYDKYTRIKFPEGSLTKPKKFCRNPNGDLGGPWCFVEDEDTNEIEREYCDIPFCDEPDCEVFSKDQTIYTHYTDFNGTLANFSFGLKLWDSDSYPNASAKLLLSLLPLPLSGSEVRDLGIGLEIYISNEQSALTFGNVDANPDYEDTKGILKSTEYTKFELTWHAPFISLFKEGEKKPIFLAEYKTKKNLLGFKPNTFRYYSAMGTNVLWSFPFCKDDFECDVHTTTGSNFQQFWPMLASDVGHELHFHLRAFHSVNMLFRPTPAVDFPSVKIAFQSSNLITRVTAHSSETSTVVIKEISLPNLLDYWEWREFSLMFFSDTLHLYWTKSVGSNMVFELKHELFRKMLWFSPSSDNTVAHWSFFCRPPEFTKPPPALMPECALNVEEENYKGTQDVTEEGLPCLPWSGKKLVPQVTEDFKNQTILQVWNYCRDPLNEKRGTYCFAIQRNPERKIEKKYCRLRKCKSEQCRMAGTGNDYIGQTNRTRSNRTCQKWIGEIKPVHKVDLKYTAIILFADEAPKDAKNNCRNPSRNIAGSWCYTTDRDVVQDLCNVRDCDRPEENVIIMTAGHGWVMYVLPEWKITGMAFGVKLWNPDTVDGISFAITPLNGNGTIQLLIGAIGNQKLRVYFNEVKVKEQTLPHLISSGKWTDFWLLMKKGEVALGFKGIPNSFFQWTSDDIFDPMFIKYQSIDGYPMGIFFRNGECHTENVTGGNPWKIHPVGLRSKTENAVHRSLNLTVRGDGIGLIYLMALPEEEPYYVLKVDSLTHELALLNSKTGAIFASRKVDDLMKNNSWTNLTVKFDEKVLTVFKGNETAMEYKSHQKPILIYWFTVAVETGWFTWSANCEPIDIDGSPRDGGWSAWSQWQCTVSCGGGEGFRMRTCTNPSPNIFGKLCSGSPKSTGICNDFECGDISINTLENIRHNLQINQYSYVIKEGRTVVLQNDNDQLKVIEKESPNAYFEWALNGVFVRLSAGRITSRGNDLVISNAEPSDAGVYICMVYRINKKRVVLRVITLAVITVDYTVKTRATKPYVLSCNSVVLAYIYSDLSLKLLLNDKVYKDFGITMLAAVNSEHFDSLNKSHTGDWKCLVEQKDLKLSWVTNYVRIQVKKAPNMYTNLMEDDFTRPLFGWLKSELGVKIFLVFIVIFVLVGVGVFLFVFFKYCTIKNKWK